MEDSFSEVPNSGSDVNQHRIIGHNERTENIEEEDLSDTSEQNNNEEAEDEGNENSNGERIFYTPEQLQEQQQQQQQQQQQIFHYQHQQLLQQQHMAALQQHINQVSQSPNPNLSQLQLQQQHQIAMTPTPYGLPMHIMARMSQLPPAQQQQFHIQHQLYMQKLQQLQQAQARGQMIPPAQLQILEAHRHYLAMLVGGFQPNAQQLQQFQQQQQQQAFQLQSQQHPGQNQPQQVPVQLTQPNQPLPQQATAQYQQQVQKFHIQQVNAQAQVQGGSNPNPTNLKAGSVAWAGTGAIAPASIQIPYALSSGASMNPQHHMVPLMSPIPMVPVTSLQEAQNQIQARSDATSTASSLDRISPGMSGLQAIPTGLSFSNTAFRPIQTVQESISYKEQTQKIPLPPWLQAHGEKRHSEKQLVANVDLTKTKKKYRMSLCLYCAKVFPHSPWATLKSRKFEHEIFRKHEKSSLHQRALIELNKSATIGNPSGSGPIGNSAQNPNLIPGGHFLLDISTARPLSATQIMQQQQLQQQMRLKQLQQRQLDQQSQPESTLNSGPQNQSGKQAIRASGSTDRDRLSGTAGIKRRRPDSSDVQDTMQESGDFDADSEDEADGNNENDAYESDHGEVAVHDHRDDDYNNHANYYNSTLPDMYSESTEPLSSLHLNSRPQQPAMSNSDNGNNGSGKNGKSNGQALDYGSTTDTDAVKPMGRHIPANMLPPPVKLSTVLNAHFPLALLNHHAPLLSSSARTLITSSMYASAPQKQSLLQQYQYPLPGNNQIDAPGSSRDGAIQDIASTDVGTIEYTPVEADKSSAHGDAKHDVPPHFVDYADYQEQNEEQELTKKREGLMSRESLAQPHKIIQESVDTHLGDQYNLDNSDKGEVPHTTVVDQDTIDDSSDEKVP